MADMDPLKEDVDTLFKPLYDHLAEVEQNPQAQPLDAELLRRVERSLDFSTSRENLFTLLQTGERLLQTLAQDPTPLTRLLERVVHLLPFDEIKSSITIAKLEEGLKSPSNAVQLLCLAYLRKAADTPSGAGFVASSSSLVKCMVTVWLSSESTEAAERSIETLALLLDVDRLDSVTVVTAKDGIGEAQGQGLLWRRLFHDSEVYSLFYGWTSLKISKHDLKSKKGMQMVTISQARLFDFLVRAAAMDWSSITTSTIPTVEKKYNRGNEHSRPYGGLLGYAASSMIDPSDILMDVLRQDFFMNLLNVIEEASSHTKLSLPLLEAIKEDAGVKDDEADNASGIHL